MSAIQSARTGSLPDGEIKLVVPIEPGGIIDFVASPLAARLESLVQQKVSIDYRPGALTQTGSAYVSSAAGDGRTMLVHSRQLVNNVFISEGAVNPLTDLVPVSLVAVTPFVLVVHPALPVHTVSDLLRLAAEPGTRLRYANSGRASNQQMAVELLKSLGAVSIEKREYDGGGGAMDAVVSGDSDLGIFAQVASMNQVTARKVRAIAVTGSEPSPVLHDVPTVTESGLPGYQFNSWVGVFAPASTPPEVLAACSSCIMTAAGSPDFKAQMDRQGAVAVGNSPAEFADFIQSELSLWGGIIEQSGV